MRALILFLALLLPLQLSWAAMASYCQGERSSAPAHPGHHEHPAAQSAQTDSDHAKTGEADSGCSLCQFSCMKSVQWPRLSMADHGGTSLEVFRSGTCHPASHIADGPDKPNWLLAA
ncbi:cobalt transporter [Herbaspirillum sp. NPDC087042]|uniref:cobalt transporter n=1 Tax=Herbaspirillum sp. NPDC087042 TaxID=3364004 RepID=UPI0038082E93